MAIPCSFDFSSATCRRAGVPCWLLACSCFLGMPGKRVSKPGSLCVSFGPYAETILVARNMSLQHVVKLVPVDRSEVIVPSFVIPLEIGIWNGQSEIFGLRYSLIDHLLSQLVIRIELDSPLRGLGA